MDNYSSHVSKLHSIQFRIRECNEVLRNIGEEVLGHAPIKNTEGEADVPKPVGLLSETNLQVVAINTELDKTQQMLNTFYALFFKQEEARIETAQTIGDR